MDRQVFRCGDANFGLPATDIDQLDRYIRTDKDAFTHFTGEDQGAAAVFILEC